MIGRGAVLFLGAIAALGSLATQLLVPALPSIAGELGVGIASAQLVVGVFLVGLGGGQLLVGPLADRIDRRRLLAAGLLLYAAGSLAAGLSESLGALLLARLAQAIGSAAGLVTARVLLNAMVPPEKAVAAQASLMAVVLVSPALAPVIGGLLTELAGWRWIMFGLSAVALVAIAPVLRRLPQAAPAPAGRPRMAEGYGRLLRNRRFLAAATAMTFSSGALYVFLGSAPFLLEGVYRMTPRETGLCLLLVACASIAGTRLVGRAQRRLDPLMLGTGMGLAAMAALSALSGAGNPPLALLLGPIVLLGAAAGFTGPSAIAHILASERSLEGTATSLAGAVQMGASAALAWMLGPIAAQGALYLALALLPLTCVAALAAVLLRRGQMA